MSPIGVVEPPGPGVELLSGEAPPPARSPGAAPDRAALPKRLLREPLVHFLLLGAALFGISRALAPGSAATGPSRQIVLTLDDLRQLQIGFAAQWKRPPTAQEMLALVESRVREEVLYREALALGLDKDDTIVRRRMAQKMEFLAEDASDSREPTEAELRAWFEKNTKAFAQPARATLHHVYFSPDRRGARAREDAASALGRLAGKPADWPSRHGIGDPFMFQDYLPDRAADQLAKEFGPPFARAVFEQKPGSWQGPIESGYGWHLVFLDSVTPLRISAFEEVESDVRNAWLAERRDEAWKAAYDKMRKKYELILLAPPAAADGAAAAPGARAKPGGP